MARLALAMLAAVPVLVRAHVALGESCPSAVELAGEPALIGPVRDLLGARGITREVPRCPVVHVRIERRGAGLVVDTDGPDGAVIERAVSGAETAATVIESWVSDATVPLLATRAVPWALEPDDQRVAAPPAVAVVLPRAGRAIQLFAAEETSVASDGTVWEGLQLEACIMLGPICAAARLHGGAEISSPASLSGLVRHSAELYVGINVPVSLGRVRLTPGFAAGMGTMFTRRHDADEGMGVEITGLRAELQVALSIPLSDHLALDVVTSVALTQATGMETQGHEIPVSALEVPDEPRAFLRLAVGVRYGAR